MITVNELKISETDLTNAKIEDPIIKSKILDTLVTLVNKTNLQNDKDILIKKVSEIKFYSMDSSYQEYLDKLVSDIGKQDPNDLMKEIHTGVEITSRKNLLFALYRQALQAQVNDQFSLVHMPYYFKHRKSNTLKMFLDMYTVCETLATKLEFDLYESIVNNVQISRNLMNISNKLFLRKTFSKHKFFIKFILNTVNQIDDSLIGGYNKQIESILSLIGIGIICIFEINSLNFFQILQSHKGQSQQNDLAQFIFGIIGNME